MHKDLVKCGAALSPSAIGTELKVVWNKSAAFPLPHCQPQLWLLLAGRNRALQLALMEKFSYLIRVRWGKVLKQNACPWINIVPEKPWQAIIQLHVMQTECVYAANQFHIGARWDWVVLWFWGGNVPFGSKVRVESELWKEAGPGGQWSPSLLSQIINFGELVTLDLLDAELEDENKQQVGPWGSSHIDILIDSFSLPRYSYCSFCDEECHNLIK